MAPAPPLTTEEYFQTPLTVLPQELIYGILHCADAPTPRHQSAVGAFYLALFPFVRDHGLGRVYLSPIDVVFDAERHLILQPDLLFISRARLGVVKDRVRGVPEMVVEVLSPKPRIGKLDERLAWFAEYGVRECWLLHQLDRRLEIVTMSGGAITARNVFGDLAPIRSAVLPGFDRTLASILQE